MSKTAAGYVAQALALFITDFAGSVYRANLDGSDQKTLLFAQGNLTGIAYAEIQAQPPA
jgi:hypothetical protein